MDSQDTNSHSIIVANCISCQGLVRVPVKAPANSDVRCPHCSQSYSLAQILADVLPELEVVEDVSEEVIPHVDRVLHKTEDGKGKFVVPPQLSKGARRRRKKSRSHAVQSDGLGAIEEMASALPEEPEQTPEEYGIVEREDVPETSRSSSSGSNRSRRGSSSSRRSSRSTSSRPAKKGPSATAEMLKIVFGGLLAIPIAYAIVLGVFKQDPLKIAPTVEKVVPFLVPAELKSINNEVADPKKEDDGDVVDIEETPLSIPKINSN